MIGFFRRIRKKLADDNKPMKYMRYAIGEILLVMIGILLALQVNNWNEERKSKKIEKDVLASLSVDIKRDYSLLQEIDSLYKIDIEDLNKAHDLINKDHHTMEESLNLKYFGVTLFDFNPRRTTYDEMINSGKIYNLSNKILLENIIDYYELIEGLIYETRQSRTEFKAVFYGPHLNTFWLTHNYSDPKHKELVYNFYNNPNSKEYKILKQISAWSTVLGPQFKTKISNLSETNRTLLNKIEREILD